MQGEDCPAPPIAAAIIGPVDQSRVCVNTLVINRATSHGPFWPTCADHGWVYPHNYVRMPFGLANAGVTFQRLARAMLIPCLAGRGEESEEMLGPSEGPEPRETTGP